MTGYSFHLRTRGVIMEYDPAVWGKQTRVRLDKKSKPARHSGYGSKIMKRARNKRIRAAKDSTSLMCGLRSKDLYDGFGW